MNDNIFKKVSILFILFIFFSKIYCQEDSPQRISGLVDSTFIINDTIFIERYLSENCPIKRFILDKDQAKFYRVHSPYYRDFLKELNIDSAISSHYYPSEFMRQIESSNIACKGKTNFSNFPKDWRDLSIFKGEVYINTECEKSRGLIYQKGYFFEDVGWMVGVMPYKILSIRKLNRFQHEVVTLSTFYDSVMHYETEIVTLIDTVRKIYAWGNKIIRTPINNTDIFPQIITESDCKSFPIYFKETDYIPQRIYEIEAILREELKYK